MRTTNPALSANIFAQARSYGVGEQMTIQGTVNKCFILLFLLVASAWWVWSKVMQPVPVFGYEAGQAAPSAAAVSGYISGGAIVGFIIAIVTVFKKEWARFTAPAYALCEGLVLGGISAMFERQYPGIVVQAISLTFGTLFCMLMIYKSGVIKVTDNFRMGLFAATGGIALVYLVSWVMSFFGSGLSFIYSNSLISIGFSFLVVGIAALNLVLDFDFIEKGSQAGVHKYMEWYAAFGLMVTLVWLYTEILRLLSKLQSRR